MRHSTLIIIALAGLAALAQSGCQFMPHSLQPNQLWKLNRQSPRDVRYEPHQQPEFTLAAAHEPALVELAAR